MKTLFSICSIVWLAASAAQAQFVLDCACLAQLPSLTVTNCQATVPDLCAVVTNCFRSTVVPPPPIPAFQCTQTPVAGTIVGPGNHPITVTIQFFDGTPPVQCPVTFHVVPPITGPFSLQCAANKTVNCGTQWNFDPPTVVNPCCPNAAQPNGGATVTVTSTVTNGVCPMVITRTWQAVDQCGQTATCSQTVTVVDTVPPTINCGQNTTVVCGQAWNFTVPIISDNCTAPSDLVLTIVSTTTNANCAPTFVATRVWRVTDLCGNSTTCTQVVTLVDTTPPTIQCNLSKIVECGSNWVFDNPTASDNCGAVTLSVLSTVTNGTCPEVITRTWSAADGCGNSNTCSQTVTVRDTTPPVLNCACLQNNPNVPLTVTGCSNAVPDLCLLAIGLAPSCATDNCGPLTCAQSPAAGTVVGPGVYPITLTVYDCASNAASCVVNFTVVAPPGGCVSNPCPPTLTGVLNTGTTNGNGGLLPTGVPEQVWINVTAPGGPTPMVVADTNQWPIFFGPWLQPTATSAWISPSVGMQGPTGLYTNRVIYNAQCDRVCLTGRVASDDDGYLFVNGVFVTGSGFTAWSNVNHCADFVAGPNVIEFVVNNANGPTGFRTELEFYEQCCCNTFTNVWNTGMDGPNPLAVGQPDPNYVLVSGPAGCTGPAQVVGGIPGQWVPNGPNSQWIGGGPNANCDSGVYHYRLSFDLPCTDGASVMGQWTADDFGAVHLNGQLLYSIPNIQFPYSFTGWHPLLLTNGFVCGTNYLDFYVTNAHGVVNPTGFRAELTNVFDDCCCGPLQETSSYHSGVNAGGMMPVLSLDPQLVLSCAPPGVATGPAQVTNPNPFWLPNGPDSQWLAPVGNPNLPGGLYCYTYRFTLPPCTNGTPKYAVKGQWMGDDAGTIHVNGIPTGNNLPNGWAFTNWHPISITSGLNPGVNTLTFFVTNASFGDTGIRVELTNSASCCDCVMTNCTVTINCSTNLDIESCSIVGGQVPVTYPLPTASSTCGAISSIICTPPSGSPFPVGTTTVNCTATDANGHTASCSFTVTVRPDSTPPVIDCTCLQSQLPRSVTACFAPIPNVCFAQCYSDNCTPASQLICKQSPAAGTIVPGGASYIITVTVTDAAGNSTQCQVGFTVIAPTDTRVWNTGGTGSQAANFTVIQTPGGPANIPAVPTAIATGAWLPNDATSSWVSFTPNSQNAAPGVYIYRLTFNIPCTNGASIAGRFMSDDAARIWLNGVPTPALSTSFSTWTPVSLTSGFVSGVNTLDIYVTNATIWTGIRTELTNNFNCCCPQAIALNCPRTPVRGWTCSPNGVVNVPFNVTASSLCPSPGVTVSVTCVPPSPGPFPVGTTTVTCTATDSLGNTESCSFPVTVVRDIIPPTITCPNPITRVICANSVPVYYKAIARDDCSPTVSVVCVPPSGTVFTTGTTIVTCTATDACGNTASCSFPVTVINNQIWQTLPSGINDCFAQSGFEPNSPGVCLNTAYPGGNWKNYDITTVNRWVGHTWSFPASWTISAAQLATRARPPINGCSGSSDNDSFSLGLANCSPATWLWSRYLGSGNASPGLINKQWCSGSGCNYSFNLDLAALPLTPSGTISLLPHMNSVDRLDLFFQDDTTVDFAQLRVLRCAPSHVIGGIAAELSSARLVYGPIVWCIIRDTPATTSFSARFHVGEADGLRLPIEPLTLADHPGSALALGDMDTGVPVDRLRVTLQDDGSALVSLGELPAGVTHIDLEIEVNGEIVQSIPNMPATAGQPLVEFDGREPLIELASANGNELLASILSQEPDQPTEKQTLRIRHRGRAKTSEAEMNLNAINLPEIGVVTPELQTTLRESPTRSTKVYFSGSDASLAEVSGGQCVISPLHNGDEPGTMKGGKVRFNPTGEFRAMVPAPFGTFAPVPTNAELRSIVRGLIDGEEVDVDLARFVAPADGTFGFDFTWSSARVHPVNKIYKIAGPGGTTRLVVPGGSNVVVHVDELPVMHGKLGGRTPCRRFTWPKPTTMRIAGETYEGTELQVLVETDDYPVTALTGLRLEAIGAESLMISSLGVGPEEYRLEIPELTLDGLWLRWSGFGGVLEEAPTVLGPWAPTPGQAEQTQGEVLTPHDPATQVKLFRVRGL